MKTINKILHGIIILIILVDIIFFFPKFTENSIKEEKETIKVGADLPLTGLGAYTGISTKKGIETAKDSLVNTKYNYEIYYEDSQYTTKGGVDAYQKLVNINNIDAVIPFASFISIAIQPLVNKDKILEIATATTAPKYSTPDDLSFRTIPGVEVQTKKLVEFMNKKDYAKLGIYYVSNDFGQGARNSLIEELKKYPRIKVVSEENYLSETKDHRTSLLKIKQAKPEAVFIVSAAANYIDIFKQTKEINFQTQYLSISSSEDIVLKNSMKEAEGLIYTYYNLDTKNTETKKFFELYKNKFNEDPDGYAAEGYEAYRLTVLAFEKCGKDSLCIKNYLTNLKNYNSVFGPLSFDNNGDVNYEFILKTVKGGKFVKYEK